MREYIGVYYHEEILEYAVIKILARTDMEAHDRMLDFIVEMGLDVDTEIQVELLEDLTVVEFGDN